MELPRVNGLRADLVPHREWALCRWFYANPVWYYHRPSEAHEIDTRGRFYQLVDPELRDVCRLLNDLGIQTTPSCQGHSYPRERFERIWETLKQEENPIRTEGLEVKDSENQQPQVFRDPAYRVPWERFDDFYRDAASHQNVGYLGIIVPGSYPAFARSLREQKYASVGTTIEEDPRLSRALGGSVFAVRVDSVDPQARSIEWQNLTAYVRALLEKTARAPG